MKQKTAAIVFASLVILFGFEIKAQDVNEILENHFETIGMESLKNKKTIKVIGKQLIPAQGLEFPFTLYQTRPNNMRIDGKFQEKLFIQAYDGSDAWQVLPWTGSVAPQDMAGPQLKAFKQSADMDGILYNYADKGYTADYEGTEDVEGTEAHKIRMTSSEGDETWYFIDADSFILLQTKSKIKVGEAEVEATTVFGNYQQIDGIAIAFSIENRSSQGMSQTVVDEVVFDSEIDNSIFTRPTE